MNDVVKNQTANLEALTLARRAVYECITILMDQELHCKRKAVKIIHRAGEQGPSETQKKRIEQYNQLAKKLDGKEQALRKIHQALMFMSIERWLEDTKGLSDEVGKSVAKVKEVELFIDEKIDDAKALLKLAAAMEKSVLDLVDIVS